MIYLVHPGQRKKTIIAGSGRRGWMDGPLEVCRFDAPASVVRDPHTERLYVADKGNHRLRCLDLACGMVSTVCGNGLQGCRDADRGLDSSLNAPFNLSFSEPHYLIVSCSDNSIKKFNIKTTSLETILIGT